VFRHHRTFHKVDQGQAVPSYHCCHILQSDGPRKLYGMGYYCTVNCKCSLH
jgi:hypothetical protein